jgi:hypothetical protein
MYNVFDDPHNWDKEVISLDSRRKYEYKTNPKEYSIQTISVEPGDVILVHVAEDLDIDTINAIHGELIKAFPKNNVLIANEYILKGLTIVKPRTGAVNIKKYDDIDGPEVLNEWLKKNVEFNI